MRGKRPKDRDNYILRLGGGTLVEVSREVYLEWHQSRRREKYQEERNRKHGVCSLEQRMETGDFFPSARGGPEDAVIRRMCRDKLRDALAELSGPDIFLIRLLYFEEVSISEAARLCGCSRKTIRNRREKILAELNRRMSKSGVTDGNF